MTLPAVSNSGGPGGAPAFAERIYVGIDIGYREHVVAACPLSVFNTHRHRDAWKRVKTLRFGTDADGFRQLQRYLDDVSTDRNHFLILMEPTGGYYAVAVQSYLIDQGYAILQVENTAVKDYREKIFATETKTDIVDARVMARMGFLHELVGEEFSIQPVRVSSADTLALRPMVLDYLNLQKEINRRKNQLQQINSAVFPELKTIFRESTAGRAARALVQRYPTPKDLAAADPGAVAELLHGVRAYKHARQAAEIVDLARRSVGVPNLAIYRWRQQWLIKQLPVLEEARAELVAQLEGACRTHPYAPLIDSLPVRSPIWTAMLIAVIGDIDRFPTYAAFRAYTGWSSSEDRSGTSVHSSRLAAKGVRMARRALSQMVVVLVSPHVRDTPFRAYYKRLLERGMPPLKAQGHTAGKLSTVIYSLIKNHKPYDERKHWKDLGIEEPKESTPRAAVEVSPKQIDDVEEQAMALTDPPDESLNGTIAL